MEIMATQGWEGVCASNSQYVETSLEWKQEPRSKENFQQDRFSVGVVIMKKTVAK